MQREMGASMSKNGAQGSLGRVQPGAHTSCEVPGFASILLIHSVNFLIRFHYFLRVSEPVVVGKALYRASIRKPGIR
jgi:hypothetical protein